MQCICMLLNDISPIKAHPTNKTTKRFNRIQNVDKPIPRNNLTESDLP